MIGERLRAQWLAAGIQPPRDVAEDRLREFEARFGVSLRLTFGQPRNPPEQRSVICHSITGLRIETRRTNINSLHRLQRQSLTLLIFPNVLDSYRHVRH